MKWLCGGLTLVNVAVVSALLIGMAFGGLNRWSAVVAMLLGALGAVFAFAATADLRGEVNGEDASDANAPRRSRVWFWLLAGCFGFFAFRSFCWLLFLDGNEFKVQSPNNLGDLALHLTYINNLASGVPLWPENPIHVFSHLRYPAGTDLFNSLLLLLGVDLIRGLIWTGLIGAAASFFALYRWGGSFGVGGFLFNGGLVGFQVFRTWQLLDYQGEKFIAWKSLPLTMLVTQRGLLYALPAGLLLLYHWRAKYFPGHDRPNLADGNERPLLPFWAEAALYASMPLFHLHTFMALSIVAAFLFVIGDAAMRRHFALLVALAFLPATFFVWTITDHFQARSLMQWQPGWVQGVDDFASPFFRFWFENFGLWLPLVFLFFGMLLYRAWRSAAQEQKPKQPDAAPPAAIAELKSAIVWCAQIFRSSAAWAFAIPAALIFLFACFVKTAPWGWDNIKLIIWAYVIILPFLWSELIQRWEMPVKVGLCVVLFGSGFVSLFGGLLTEPGGYNFADRAEFDAVGSALRKLPVQARFASYPTYNHPLLLHGRKVVLGYPGHLWTQGFDYTSEMHKLGLLMNGAPDWKEQARDLRVRYLFWGREEKANYAASARPWEREAKLLRSGSWGAIYDLEASVDRVAPRQ